MTTKLNEARTEKLLKSLTLPAMPVIMNDLRKAQARDADLQTLAKIVGKDLSLSAAALKVANSPSFAGRTLDSLRDAVTVLGASNLEAIVTSIELKNAIPLPPILHTFWDEVTRTAAIASRAAKTWHLCRPDQIYLFCLFRDSGIPVLAQRFPSYLNTLARAMAEPLQFTQIEQRSRATSHTIVGYLLARTWFMPEPFSHAILCHHDFEQLADTKAIPADSARLISAARLAEHVLRNRVLNELDLGWSEIEGFVLAELGLQKSDIEEFGDAVTRLA